MQLLKLNDLSKVKIISRPSKISKTPYVADIELHDGSIVQAHCASLGCCGLCEKDCYVYASPILSNCPQSKSKVCTYKVYLAQIYEEKLIKEEKYINDQIIGVDPKLAETLVEKALTSNCFPTLQNIKKHRREAALGKSRFDFIGIDDAGKYFILEVKNVPLSDFADVNHVEKKKLIKADAFKNMKFNEKISYFPDGYRKTKGGVVSERALKHINELAEVTVSNIVRPIICFVIQRTDSGSFQASNIDPTYKAAFNDAIKKGVEVIILMVSWNALGEANFVTCDLPVNL
tara:strand:+ start:2132 stop:2998 length:867 start_codon:yes stop_codon:yes gene_type:complete